MRVLPQLLVLGLLTFANAFGAALSASPALAAPQAGDAEEHYRFVLGLADQELWEQAAREAEAFLARYPRSDRADEVRYRLGVAQQELGRHEEAAAAFEPLARPRSTTRWREAAYRLARCRLALGDARAACTALERLIDAGADYLQLPATLSLADARLELGEHEAAERAYLDVERATRGADEQDDVAAAADAAWGLAWCAYRRPPGDGRAATLLERADTYLERFLDRRTDRKTRETHRDEMQFLRGEALLELGRDEEATAAYAKVGEGPLAAASKRGTGYALSGLERHADAAAAFERALALDPGGAAAAECALHAGVERLKAGDAEAALAHLVHATLDRDADALYWRARAQAETGRDADALATLDRALALRPGGELEGRVRAARGDALARLGRKDEAVRAWADAGSTRGLFNAAATHLAEGRVREAAELAERLLADDPPARDAAELALILGEARFAEGDYAAAEPAYARALASAKDTEAVRTSHVELRLGWCRWFGGDARGARERFARVAGTDVEEAAEAQLMVGRAALALGDETGAARAFEDYLRRHPKGTQRAEALLALARLEPGERGVARLATLVEQHPTSPLAPEARLELADRLAEAGEHARAAREYARIAEGPASPRTAPARYGLAWCRYSLGEHAAAAEALAPLLASEAVGGELRAAACELALWCELERKDAGRAAAAWTLLLEAAPDAARWTEPTRRLIGLLREAGASDAARDVLARLSALERRAPDARCAATLAIEEVFLELEDGRVAEAEAALARADTRSREARPAAADAGGDDLRARVAEAAFFVGEARFASGGHARAAELYAAAQAEGDPAVAERALYKGGFACLQAGDAAGAAARFGRLVEEHPESPLRLEAIFLQGEALHRAGRLEECAATLERLRRTARRHEVMPKALFRLGVAYGELERWEPCAEVLAELAREHGGFERLAEAELWRGRANVALDPAKKTGDAARQALARVIELDEGDLSAQARIELGLLARAQGDLDGALSQFLRVAVLYDTPSVPRALLLAGETLERQGDAAAAAGRYRELVEKHPETEPARAARERLQKLAGR